MGGLKGRIRRLPSWWGTVLLGVLGVSLMFFSASDSRLAARARMALVDVLEPFLSVMSYPAVFVARKFESMHNFGELSEENQRLISENEVLMTWYWHSQQLEAENNALRSLTNFRDDAAVNFVSARVIADAGTTYTDSILLDAGADDGIRAGQAVLSGEGLVGRITEVGNSTARVLLITDIASRIPVRMAESGYNAVLKGRGDGLPMVDYLPHDAQIRVSEFLLTSGIGGVFPAGLPVARIVGNEGGVVIASPIEEMEGLDILRVVDYGLDISLWDVEVREEEPDIEEILDED